MNTYFCLFLLLVEEDELLCPWEVVWWPWTVLLWLWLDDMAPCPVRSYKYVQICRIYRGTTILWHIKYINKESSYIVESNLRNHNTSFNGTLLWNPVKLGLYYTYSKGITMVMMCVMILQCRVMSKFAARHRFIRRFERGRAATVLHLLQKITKQNRYKTAKKNSYGSQSC